MTKIDRYITKRFLGSFVFILMVFLMIAVVIDIAEKMDDYIERKPPLDELILDHYVNFMLFYGNLLSPICVFLAVIYFTSQMAQKTEIIPLLSAGVSFYRIMIPYLFAAIIIAGASFYLNAYLVPTATKERIDFEYKYLKNKIPMHDHHIQRKVASDPEKKAETFVYLYSFNQTINEGYIFRMYSFVGADIRSSMTCQRATYVDSTDSWLLADCMQRETWGKKEKMRFIKEVDTTFLLKPEDIFIKDQRAQSITLGELGPLIELERLRGSELVEELELEMIKRYAYPFAIIILTLIGFSVSTQKKRGGTAIQIGIGLVLSFLFVALIVAGEAISAPGFPDWLKIWMPNIIFFIAAIVMLRLSPK